MNIQELEDEIEELVWLDNTNIRTLINLHKALSIQFAIEMLEEGKNWFELAGFINNKIEELKAYL